MASEEGKKVMIAIDESESSYFALEWVLQNLQPSISEPLLIFTVQPLTNLSYVYSSPLGSARTCAIATTPPGLLQNVLENQNKVSSALVEKAKEICAKKGVIVETIVEVGDPKVVICEAVEKLKINLLILGSRGLGVIKRAFLGSVSNYCVQYAKCPVLVVKKPT